MNYEGIIVGAGVLALLGVALLIACFGVYNFALLLGEIRALALKRCLYRMLGGSGEGLGEELRYRVQRAITRGERTNRRFGHQAEENASILARRVLLDFVKSTRVARPRQRVDAYPRFINDSGLEVPNNPDEVDDA